MWRSHAVLTPPARGRLKPGGGGPGGARGGPGRDGGAGHHERGAAARCGRRSPGAEIWRHGAPRHCTGCGGQLPACTAWAQCAGTTTTSDPAPRVWARNHSSIGWLNPSYAESDGLFII